MTGGGDESVVDRERAALTLMPSAQDVALAKLLEQTARHLHALGHAEGLYPAQWAALRYFHTALPPNNTAISLARFQGMAMAPVARSIRTLIEKGLLRKAGSVGRGRLEAVELTKSGRMMLTRDPVMLIAATLAQLQPADRTGLATSLEAVIRAAQANKAD